MNLRTEFNNLGAKYKGLWYRIDTTNACGLSCPTCARAKFATPKGVMSVDTFKAVVDRTLSEGKVRAMELYAWGDSTLSPNLAEFCEYAVSKNLPKVNISSTFNTVKCDLPRVMLSGLSTVFVSFSGWEKYHITHRGGDLKKVLANFEMLASLPRLQNTRVVMRFHVYTHNQHEIPIASYAMNTGGS